MVFPHSEMLDGELEWQPRREAPLPYAMWLNICKKWKDERVKKIPIIIAIQAVQTDKESYKSKYEIRNILMKMSQAQ